VVPCRDTAFVLEQNCIKKKFAKSHHGDGDECSQRPSRFDAASSRSESEEEAKESDTADMRSSFIPSRREEELEDRLVGWDGCVQGFQGEC
jgi:hypothetical protein